MHRDLTPWAPLSALFGVSSAAALLIPALGWIGLPGAVCGLVALWLTARYDLAGRRAAIAGVVASVVFPVSARVLEAIQFHAEAPAGFERIDFGRAVRADDQGTRILDKLDGQPVCLKGYAVAQREWEGLKEFGFSANGDYRKIEEAIIVEVEGLWDFEVTPLAVSGTLRINPNSRPDQARYRLVNAIVRPARTTSGLAERTNRGC